MSNYENSSDLRQEVLRHSGELIDGTSEYNEDVMIFLNRAYQAMLSGAADLGMDIGQPWPWAKKQYPSVLIIQPTLNTFTVNAVNDSSVITFNSVISYSVQGQYIFFGDYRQGYRIKKHLAGSASAVLDSVFLEASGTAYATKIMKYDYILDSGVLRLFGPLSVTPSSCYNFDGKINIIDENTFNTDYPMLVRQGIPDRATQTFKNNEMQPTIRFNRIPAADDQPIRIEYNYIPVPDDLLDSESSIPVVPRDHRVTLCYYAAYYLLMDKNDNRAAEYRELARAGMLALVRAYKIEKANTDTDYCRLIPRPDNMGYNYGRSRYWRGYE